MLLIYIECAPPTWCYLFMKEDILEQLVDDHLQSKGYFTRHNVKFRPRSTSKDFNSSTDSNHSDIDVIGINPNLKDADRVVVVSCKSWQAGFSIHSKLKELEECKIVSGREAWKSFRELMVQRWTDAFHEKIHSSTGSKIFTYVTAVTFAKGTKSKWEKHPLFLKAMRGNPIKILTLQEILSAFDKSSSTIVAGSAIGRTIQLMKAAKKGEKYLIQEVASE